ncbi:MAG TPA: hypothetical protein VGC41_07620 [Kofleriaceae bacterium]
MLEEPGAYNYWMRNQGIVVVRARTTRPHHGRPKTYVPVALRRILTCSACRAHRPVCRLDAHVGFCRACVEQSHATTDIGGEG